LSWATSSRRGNCDRNFIRIGTPQDPRWPSSANSFPPRDFHTPGWLRACAHLSTNHSFTRSFRARTARTDACSVAIHSILPDAGFGSLPFFFRTCEPLHQSLRRNFDAFPSSFPAGELEEGKNGANVDRPANEFSRGNSPSRAVSKPDVPHFHLFDLTPHQDEIFLLFLRNSIQAKDSPRRA